jgi:predicted DNA-binding transcriptional regulator YafY
MLRLITLLQSGKAKSVAELVAELEVSRRTLFRDLNTLEQAGIPYYNDPELGYRISEKFFLPPVNLTVTETLGLLLLSKLSQEQRTQPLIGSALSGITKLTATVPEPIRTACHELMNNISVNPGSQSYTPSEREHYPVLQKCIDEGRVCRVHYQSPRPTDKDPYTFHPYALHYATRSWYVLGWVDIHDDVRVLKLARFKSIEPQPKLFVKPRKFKVSDKIGRAWQLIPEGQVHQIELEFSPRVATNVMEVRWHPSQKNHAQPDGSLRVTFEIDGLGEIAWWVCGYADQVRVVNPPELRARVSQMLKQAFSHYAGDPHPAAPLPPPDDLSEPAHSLDAPQG